MMVESWYNKAEVASVDANVGSHVAWASLWLLYAYWMK